MIIVFVKRSNKVASKSIIIPEEAKKRYADFYGIVKSIGPDWKYNDVKIGTRILFNRHEGYIIKTEDDEEIYALKPERCLAIVQEGDINVF